jgi:peptide/nickel transport system ATP-binding protein
MSIIATSPPALRIDGLTVRDAEGRRPVADVALSIPAGGSLCIIGETGSGKSLVAQAIMGLLPHGLAAEGRVAFGEGSAMDARDGKRLRALWSRHMTMIPQEPGRAFDPLMRIGRQIASTGSRPLASVGKAFAAVDLAPETADLYPFQLSGGMAQRALIAHALMTKAPLIIADEPTKGLDGPRVRQVITLLRGLIDARKSLLVVTHDLEVAHGLGGEVAVMRDGAVVEQGPWDRIMHAPTHPYTRAWLDADPSRWPACAACLDADDMVLAGHGLTFGYDLARPLFRDLDLHVHRGEVLALVGPSGAGKSTLGQVLLGLQRPQAGEVSWAGCDPYRDPAGARRLRRRYQKLHQDPATVFVTHRTIGAQLDDVLGVDPGVSTSPQLPDILDRLKLAPVLLDRRIGEVSGGEAQRLAIARLLMLSPSLIVADEPTSRLDPIVQKETIDLLRGEVQRTGLALVLVSHNGALVQATADEVVEL